MLQAVIAVGHLSINEFTPCSILREDAIGELGGGLEKGKILFMLWAYGQIVCLGS